MKIYFKKTALFLTIALICFSCSNDDDSNDKNSREIKYEVAIINSGIFGIIYTDSDGEDTLEEIENTNNGPWIKEVKLDDNVKEAKIAVGVLSGTKGNTITVKVYSGGKLVREKTASTNANQLINLQVEPYVIP